MAVEINTLQQLASMDLSIVPTGHGLPITQYTSGDLHANTMKMVWELVYHGVCRIDQASYSELYNIYQARKSTNDVLSAEKVKRFAKIISSNLEVINPKCLTRCIGDLMCDRGPNDLLTLELLECLQDKGADITIISSNHDIEFIFALENYERNGNKLLCSLNITTQATSLAGLQQSLDDGLISIDKLREKYYKCYLPRLKIIDYSLSKEKPQNISIYSHAPIDLEVIEQLATKFGVSYKDNSPGELAKTIDAINQKYVSCVRAGKFSLIYNNNKANHTVGVAVHKDMLTSDIAKFAIEYGVPYNTSYEGKTLKEAIEKINSVYKRARKNFVNKEDPIECCIWNRYENLNAGSHKTDGLKKEFCLSTGIL